MFSRFTPNSSFNKVEFINKMEYIQLSEYQNLNDSNLNNYFPHKLYINSDNWKSVSKVNEDLNYLHSVNANKFQNFNVLINDITVNNKYWHYNNLDTLNLLVEWAETFNIENNIYPQNSTAFKAIHNYWMGIVAKSLDSLISSNYNIKFDFRVKYLRQRCIQTTHGTGTGEDDITKIVNNIIERKWHYLFIDRIWNSTTIQFKIIIILFLIITSISYIFFFSYIYNTIIRLKNKNKSL